MVDWLAGDFARNEKTKNATHQPTGNKSAPGLVGWLVGRLVGWLVGWLVG